MENKKLITALHKILAKKPKWKPKTFPQKKDGQSEEDWRKQVDEWVSYVREINPTKNWVDKMQFEDRENIPEQDKNAKLRGILRIIPKTKTRTRNNQPELLLLRTITNEKDRDEYDECVKHDSVYHNLERSSWSVTSNQKRAEDEAKIMHEVIVYAWIPITSIVSIPFMYGKFPNNPYDTKSKGKNPKKYEYEVIVSKGEYDIEKVDKTFFVPFNELWETKFIKSLNRLWNSDTGANGYDDYISNWSSWTWDEWAKTTISDWQIFQEVFDELYDNDKSPQDAAKIVWRKILKYCKETKY